MKTELSCAVCAKSMARSKGSKPQGEAVCHDCRRTPEWKARRAEHIRERNRHYQMVCRSKRRSKRVVVERPRIERICVVCATPLGDNAKTKCDQHKYHRPTACGSCGKLHYNTNVTSSTRNAYCLDCKPIRQESIKATALEWKRCPCGQWVCRPNRKHCQGCVDANRSRSRECPDCGSPLERSKQRCKPCRDERRKDAQKSARKSAREKYGSRNCHRKRARFYGVEYEPVNRQRVFERDNWCCRLCGKRVDKRVVVPHPMAATLDHIVPMSLGGAHSYVNTQCAHFICNSRKSNIGHGDQLALIG